MPAIVLFDGDCNFCDASVQFILNRDSKGNFHFASLQGEAGKDLRIRHRIPEEIDSIVLLKDGVPYLKSDAAIRIAEGLDGGWQWLRLVRVVPRPIRDFGYDVIAKNRYKWFGMKETCKLPTPEERSRFIDQQTNPPT
ncbi:thiol-disulfide oxidoreductase DCC family protein [Exiguobacterium sp. TNDT2]|uniref:thiol-disulfide oxidoreductase DCC family protein n=1 Tax=Exiguobacterium sp. TNDT2 TaxID=2233531 RepID=UPI0018E554A9|nr:thiol-disulfide oxidoreductase DCC family protein [Exiguobacterium sp. TNDT2]